MILTSDQERAIDIAVKNYREKQPYTCIAGYAGTGKSTVVKYIIDRLGIPKDKVAFTSYTGKAAQVLRHMGNDNTLTTHQLMYFASRLKTGQFVFKKRASLNGTPKLVIVDEISMLPKEMWKLLLSFHVPIICLGDPYQLPPVSKDTDQDNHVLDNPHIFLTKIHRQAEDNEIIYNSMRLREGKEIEFQKSDHLIVIPANELTSDLVLSADQVICATNKVRQEFNTRIRQLKGLGPEVEDGDRLICVQNYWQEYSKFGVPITNGTIGYVQNGRLEGSRILGGDVLLCDFITTDGEIYSPIQIDYNYIKTGQPIIDYVTAKKRRIKWTTVPKYFLYAYAITCHKAQGDQWDKVFVAEERFPFDKEEHQRWLYTALTRAKEQCIIVRK